MRRLQQALVKQGKVKGRVHLTLENADGVFQTWLDRKQAERLAADIFTCRFELPGTVLVDRPPQWKKPPTEVFISFRTTMPLGPMPSAHWI